MAKKDALLLGTALHYGLSTIIGNVGNSSNSENGGNSNGKDRDGTATTRVKAMVATKVVNETHDVENMNLVNEPHAVNQNEELDRLELMDKKLYNKKLVCTGERCAGKGDGCERRKDSTGK